MIIIDYHRLSSIIINCHQNFWESQNNKYQSESTGMNNKQVKKTGKICGENDTTYTRISLFKGQSDAVLNPFGSDRVDHDHASYRLLLADHFRDLLSFL